jgi:hypothetical protein
MPSFDTRADVEGLVAAAGGFAIEGMLGALDEAVTLDEKGAPGGWSSSSGPPDG